MKKKPPLPLSPPRWRGILRRLVVIGAVLSVVAAVVYGLVQLDSAARRNIGPRARYEVKFADIECDPPPGLDRATFLAEVRYAGNVSETFNLMADERHERLSAAFAAHPWVESVAGVDVEPPARVAVRLRFRQPFLAVRTEDGPVRHVDANGVLLPVSAVPADVPELATPVPPPTTAAGQPWADNYVRRAVELVKAYHPAKVERTPTGWRLKQPDGKALNVGE